MHPRKTRFVAVCQQLLVLSVAGAALVPAARMVDLDLVPGDAARPAPVTHAPAPRVHHGARDVRRDHTVRSAPGKR